VHGLEAQSIVFAAEGLPFARGLKFLLRYSVKGKAWSAVELLKWRDPRTMLAPRDREVIMKARTISMLLSLPILLSACTSFYAGSNLAAGRRAMLAGNNEAALAYFQSAAQIDPNYKYGTAYQQGVLSYLGRSEYALGRLPQARETLEKALTANRSEDITRLYLGLTYARSGDRQRGLKEIEGGMRGIHEWIEWVTEAHRFSFGQFWDPAREIRRAIQSDLAMISGREFDWQKLIADSELIAKLMEEEIDRSRLDEAREHDRNSDSNDSPR
jgi:tetratricopeptide (TPR) repeat protein